MSNETLISWIVERLNTTKLKRIDIRGCDHAASDDVYLTRWRLTSRSWPFGVYIHVFRRSDSDRAFHDHPWSFITISSLLTGYLEETPKRGIRRAWPLIPLYRPAVHRHRVVLHPDGRGGFLRCVSLVLVGRRQRDWGFIPFGQDWIQWEKFLRENNCL